MLSYFSFVSIFIYFIRYTNLASIHYKKSVLTCTNSWQNIFYIISKFRHESLSLSLSLSVSLSLSLSLSLSTLATLSVLYTSDCNYNINISLRSRKVVLLFNNFLYKEQAYKCVSVDDVSHQ